MSNNTLVWTDDRCEELESLGELLRSVANINSGSGCLQRIARCIDLAESLLHEDLDRGRESFYRFTRRLAIEDRTFNRTEMKGE